MSAYGGWTAGAARLARTRHGVRPESKGAKLESENAPVVMLESPPSILAMSCRMGAMGSTRFLSGVSVSFRPL